MTMLTRHKIDEGVYEVRCFGEHLGTIRYNPEALTCGRWFIDGGRYERGTYGRKQGHRTLSAAVKAVGMWKSAKVIKLLCLNGQ